MNEMLSVGELRMFVSPIAGHVWFNNVGTVYIARIYFELRTN